MSSSCFQGRIQHGYKVRPDLCATDCPVCPTEFREKFYTDSLVHDEEALQLLISKIGHVNMREGAY